MPSTHLSLHVLVVFSTKERHPLIKADVREKLHSFICSVARRMDAIPESVGGTVDHIHILIGLRATHRLCDVVRELKSESSKWLHETTGTTDFAWQDGYGAFTVSASQRDRVKAYVLDQEAHHNSHGYKTEYVSLLEKSGVEFDEKYLR